MAELYQVEFKGSRREFFFNLYHHTLKLNDYVIIEAEQGEDMGMLAKRIESEIEFPPDKRPRSILRPAGPEDMDRFRRLKDNETRYKKEVIGVIRKHGLEMKVVDVECLFDGSKITFFFTADHRVDFRALVRDLASRYRTRIELRQIGVRDEARRIDGYGICGRRQCCNGHIRDFQPISTQHAREQDLSLNPAKISGNCGRLLCCLRYEVDLYSSVKQKFPPVGTAIKTPKGYGKITRIDVFSEEAVFTNEEDVVCRVKAGEITERIERDRGSKAIHPRVEADTTPEEAAELARLDESENNGKKR